MKQRIKKRQARRNERKTVLRNRLCRYARRNGGEMRDASLDGAYLSVQYMPRPRVDRIFDQATRCKLVYVIAGAGYGKTQAVYRYLEQQPDAVVRWVQLSESDNVDSHYWESFTHSVSLDNPELAFKLRELGFPETPAKRKQFAAIQKSTEHRSHKIFLVLDDFHLIHARQALGFVRRYASLQIPGLCVIIISRKEPEINTVSLLARGEAGIVTEDDLRFTDEEIAAFLKWRGVSFSARSLPRLSQATQGWAMAVQLLALVLKRIVCVKSCIASKKYNYALTVLCNSFPREPQERFLFGELTLALLTAVAKANTGDAPGAVREFEKAYALSFGGVFEMPFIELGKQLRPLAAAASKQARCAVPKAWLTTMERKASAYAKKSEAIANMLKREQKIDESVQLSEREGEVLTDLYHGLSRDEIAASRYLSINTVKKILQSIYIKLDADSNVDAVRIALEKKLIE